MVKHMAKRKKRKESESNFMQSAELTGLLLILIGIIGFGCCNINLCLNVCGCFGIFCVSSFTVFGVVCGFNFKSGNCCCMYDVFCKLLSCDDNC